MTPTGTRSWLLSCLLAVILRSVQSSGERLLLDNTASWISWTSPGLRNWWGLATSSDGRSLYAGFEQAGYLYASSDYGDTWTQRSVSGATDLKGAVACSADGIKVAIGQWAGYLFTSSDSGVTWTKQMGSSSEGRRRGIAMSADGRKLLVADSNADYLAISIDYGVTWTSPTSTGKHWFFSCAASSDFTKLAAGTWSSDYLYLSSDSGATWTEQTSLGRHAWASISMSANGASLIACDDTSGGSIYTMTYSAGAPVFVQRTSANALGHSTTDSAWWATASSADGTVLAAASGYSNNPSYILTSTDGGATWAQQTAAGSKQWWVLKLSADGSRLAATNRGGYIWGLQPTPPPTPAPTPLVATISASTSPTYLRVCCPVQSEYILQFAEVRLYNNGVPLTGLTGVASSCYQSTFANGVCPNFPITNLFDGDLGNFWISNPGDSASWFYIVITGRTFDSVVFTTRGQGPDGRIVGATVGIYTDTAGTQAIWSSSQVFAASQGTYTLPVSILFPPTPTPSAVPSPLPSALPTRAPTAPTFAPSTVPTPYPTVRPTPLPSALPSTVPTPYPTSTVPTPYPTVRPTSKPAQMTPAAGPYYYHTNHAGIECASTPSHYDVESYQLDACMPPDGLNPTSYKMTCTQSIYGIKNTVFKKTYGSTDTICSPTTAATPFIVAHPYTCEANVKGAGYILSRCGDIPSTIRSRKQILIKAYAQGGLGGVSPGRPSQPAAPLSPVACNFALVFTRSYLLGVCAAFKKQGSKSIQYYRRFDLVSAAGGIITLLESRYTIADNRCKLPPFLTVRLAYNNAQSGCARDPLDPSLAYIQSMYYNGNVALNWPLVDAFFRSTFVPTASPTTMPTRPSSQPTPLPTTSMPTVTPFFVEVLVVAGGGGSSGGGAEPAGGGGGGGVLYVSSSPLPGGGSTVSVVVGAGGAGAYACGAGSSGGNSQFGSLVAVGGGAGGFCQTPALSGGSGGGGSGWGGSTGARSGNGTTAQGFGGGNGNLLTNTGAAGGGGGAGARGSAVTGLSGGNGGVGVAISITGTSTYYGGGGGGSTQNANAGGTAGQGGLGGGAAGASANSLNSASGLNGAANTGGGASGAVFNANGGTGGSGIVIVAYPGTQQRALGGVVDIGTRPGYTLHFFKTVGTSTFVLYALSHRKLAASPTLAPTYLPYNPTPPPTRPPSPAPSPRGPLPALTYSTWSFISTISGGQIAIDKNNLLYQVVSDTVAKISSTNPAAAVTYLGPTIGAITLAALSGVAVDNSLNVYVTEGTTTGRVLKISAAGVATVLTSSINTPNSCAFDTTTGTLWVTSSAANNNNGLYSISSDGTLSSNLFLLDPLKTAGAITIAIPYMVAVDSGTGLVVWAEGAVGNSGVRGYDPTTGSFTTIGTTDCAKSSIGNLYKQPAGTSKEAWCNELNLGFWWGAGIGVDSSGRIYFGDSNGQRVVRTGFNAPNPPASATQIWDQNVFNTGGSRGDATMYPDSIVVDSNGVLFFRTRCCGIIRAQ